ncbi:MAG: aminodeoxychorismate/anthranilate synthase component II [Acidimicrobiales bacterium]
MGPSVLVIDNYDSFTYNLVQMLGGLGALPVVHRHDALDLEDLERLRPDGILISPGPGRPEDAGISKAVIERFGSTIPILGVCLGHQCIGEVFGGRVVGAPELMHGKTSWVHHRGHGVLTGLSDPFEATRYHSLIVERASLPAVLEVTAETDGIIMAMRHRQFPIEGVQFHPESILTAEGPKLITNFLRSLAARTVA